MRLHQAPMTARLFSPLLVVLFLTACARHPLDIPPSEWNRLSPQQQALAYTKDAELTADAAQRSRLDLAERERYDVLEEAARTDRVNRRRKRMRLGDSLDCAFEDGVAKIDGLGWRPVETASLRIIRGERRTLLLTARHQGTSRPLALTYRDSGMALRLCGNDRVPTTCTTVAAPWHDLKNGTRWQVIAPETLAATLRCAFTPGEPVSVMEMD